MADLKIRNEPVVLLTKTSWISLCEVLRNFVERADAGKDARAAYAEFIEEVKYDNSGL